MRRAATRRFALSGGALPGDRPRASGLTRSPHSYWRYSPSRPTDAAGSVGACRRVARRSFHACDNTSLLGGFWGDAPRGLCLPRAPSMARRRWQARGHGASGNAREPRDHAENSDKEEVPGSSPGSPTRRLRTRSVRRARPAEYDRLMGFLDHFRRATIYWSVDPTIGECCSRSAATRRSGRMGGRRPGVLLGFVSRILPPGDSTAHGTCW